MFFIAGARAVPRQTVTNASGTFVTNTPEVQAVGSLSDSSRLGVWRRHVSHVDRKGHGHGSRQRALPGPVPGLPTPSLALGGQLAAYPLMAQWAGIGPAAATETRLLIATSEEAVNAAFKAAGNADLQRAVLDIEVVDSPFSREAKHRHTP